MGWFDRQRQAGSFGLSSAQRARALTSPTELMQEWQALATNATERFAADARAMQECVVACGEALRGAAPEAETSEPSPSKSPPPKERPKAA